MSRDPRTDPQPGDVLVFHDDTFPHIATIEKIDKKLDMVVWLEGHLPLCCDIEEWPDRCQRRKATVLNGTGPLSLFRWRPGGARGGEMPAAGARLLCLEKSSDGRLVALLTESTDLVWWTFIEWWAPIDELLPKDETHGT